jgi:hypothetical protein
MGGVGGGTEVATKADDKDERVFRAVLSGLIREEP